MSFEVNPEWQRLGSPEVGDIVLLKLNKAWQYKVKVIVTRVELELISGDVECLFDWQTDGQIEISVINELIDLTLKFHPRMIWRLNKQGDVRP